MVRESRVTIFFQRRVCPLCDQAIVSANGVKLSVSETECRAARGEEEFTFGFNTYFGRGISLGQSGFK